LSSLAKLANTIDLLETTMAMTGTGEGYHIGLPDLLGETIYYGCEERADNSSETMSARSTNTIFATHWDLQNRRNRATIWRSKCF